MSKDLERILSDFSYAIEDAHTAYPCDENAAVVRELEEARNELEEGIVREYETTWDIVDCDESRIFVHHLANGNCYRITVVIPTMEIDVTVKRVLEDGEEVDAFVPRPGRERLFLYDLMRTPESVQFYLTNTDGLYARFGAGRQKRWKLVLEWAEEDASKWEPGLCGPNHGHSLRVWRSDLFRAARLKSNRQLAAWMTTTFRSGNPYLEFKRFCDRQGLAYEESQNDYYED